MPAVRTTLGFLVILSGLLRPTHAAWTWERIEYPGSARTYANGIWGDKLVGSLDWAGFLYDAGAWTTLMFPGAYRTSASGIWGDKIVGSYSLTGFDETGFLYDAKTSTWKTLRFPGAAETHPQGIYQNRVVGYYIDSQNRYRGFLYDGSQWKTLKYPGPSEGITQAYGIWGDTVVGSYMSGWGAKAQGFIYEGAGWTSVHAGDAYNSWLTGLSGTSMLGRAQVHSGDFDLRSFVITDGAFAWLDCPLGPRIDAQGISGNHIVGTYRETLKGEDYSFLLTMPEPASLTLLALAGILPLRPRQA